MWYGGGCGCGYPAGGYGYGGGWGAGRICINRRIVHPTYHCRSSICILR